MEDTRFSEGDNLTIVVQSVCRCMKFRGTIIRGELLLKLSESFDRVDDSLDGEEVSIQLCQQETILDLHDLFAYIVDPATLDSPTQSAKVTSFSETSDFRFPEVPNSETIKLYLMRTHPDGMAPVMLLDFEDRYPFSLSRHAISIRVSELVDQQRLEGWQANAGDLRKGNVELACMTLSPILHITEDDISWESNISYCFTNATAYQRGVTYQLYLLATLKSESESPSKMWQKSLTTKKRFMNMVALTISSLERSDNEGFLRESDNIARWERETFRHAENLPDYYNAIEAHHIEMEDDEEVSGVDNGVE